MPFVKSTFTRERVAALGASILVKRTGTRSVAVEEVLVEGVTLAHRDPALARSCQSPSIDSGTGSTRRA